MTEKTNSGREPSLEEILADVRKTRESGEPPRRADRPEPWPEKEDPAPVQREEAPAAQKAPKHVRPDPGEPEEERPEDAQEAPITAEDLAGEEWEEPKQHRSLRSLLPFGHGRRKKKEEPPQEEEAPYYGLHLKSREEYKREYEQTMSFDTMPKSGEEESPYAYLFRDDGGEEHDDGLDEQVRRMREERRARVAKVMQQAGLDENEDLFSVYRREEAKRIERSVEDAQAPAHVIEKAGGLDEEERAVLQPGEEPEPAAEPKQERPARPAEQRGQAPAAEPRKESRAASRAAEPAETQEPERSAFALPFAEDGTGAKVTRDDAPGDGVVRVNRPAPSFRPAPPPVFLTEPEPAEEPEEEAPAQEPEAAREPAAQREPAPQEVAEGPAEETPEAAAQAEPEDSAAPGEAEEPAPVREPGRPASAPQREPAPEPVREPAEKKPPRVLSGGRHEHSYRRRPAVSVVRVEETAAELREAFGNEARGYPRPSRLSSSLQEAVHTPQAQKQEGADAARAAKSAPHTAGQAGAQPRSAERQGAVRREAGKPAAAQPHRGASRAAGGEEKVIRLPQATPAWEEDEAEQQPPVKRRAPVKRRRRFSVFGSEEKENRPEDEFPVDPGELEDYEKPEDAEAILQDLGAKRRTLLLRTAVTGLSLLLMLLFGLISEYSGVLPAAIPYYLLTEPYLILELIFLVLAAGFSWPVLWNGVRGLFRLQANSDSGAAVAAVVSIVQTAALLFAADRVESAAVHLYAPLAVLALLLNALGKLSMVRRVTRNFKFVSSKDPKYAVHLFEDHNTALQMGRGCVAGTPVAAYQSKTKFLRHFLRISYLPDPCEQNSQVIAPIGVVASLILCVATLLLFRDGLAALTAFTAACCVCVPMVNQLCVNLPLAQVSRIAARGGAMLSGYQALDTFSDTNAVLLDARDLFPKSNVILSGIKTFGDQHIDDAILEAAALLGEVGGTLSEIFEQVIQNRRDLLPRVENFTYEDGRGIVGWVSGHRLLVGNRELLKAYKIAPPSRDYEEKYGASGKQVLYLASGGQLMAMFLIAYQPDRRRTAELCRLEDDGVAFLVRTCDPNITPKLVARSFQIDEKSVAVLPERLGKVYVETCEKDAAASAPAWMATKGRPAAMMRLLAACIRQRGNISLAVALQNVAVALGFVLVAFLACYSGLGKLNTLFLLLYELFWTLAIVLLPKLRRP